MSFSGLPESWEEYELFISYVVSGCIACKIAAVWDQHELKKSCKLLPGTGSQLRLPLVNLYR